jgi:Na+/melibiose symporter-like transporter
MINIAGLELLSSSKNQLYIIFGVLAAIILILFLAICVMAYRSVSLQKKETEAEKPNPDAAQKNDKEVIE